MKRLLFHGFVCAMFALALVVVALLYCGLSFADGMMPGPGVTFGNTNPAVIYQSDASGDLLYDGDYIHVRAPQGMIVSASDEGSPIWFSVLGPTGSFFVGPEQLQVGNIPFNADNSDSMLKTLAIGKSKELNMALDVSGTAQFTDIIDSATATHSVSVGFANIAVQGGMGGGAWNEGMVFDATSTSIPTVFCVPLPIKQFGSDVVVDSITTQISADGVASITLCEIGRYDPYSVTYLQCYAISGAVTIPTGTNTIEFLMPVVDGFVAGQSIDLSVGLGLGSATAITISGFTINYHLE